MGLVLRGKSGQGIFPGFGVSLTWLRAMPGRYQNRVRSGARHIMADWKGRGGLGRGRGEGRGKRGVGMGLASRVFSSPTERREDRNANHGFIVLRHW